MPTMKMDLKGFKVWAAKNYGLAHAVCLAKAFTEVERERVDAYILPIFKRYEFRADIDRFASLPGHGRVLTDPDHIYLTEDPRRTDYYAECDRAHREHGFTGPEGHCPALTAESMLTDAENALLKAGEEVTGVEPWRLCLKTRERMLDLLVGACLKAKNEVVGARDN